MAEYETVKQIIADRDNLRAELAQAELDREEDVERLGWYMEQLATITAERDSARALADVRGREIERLTERAERAERERDDIRRVLEDLNDDGVEYEDDLIAATERDTAEAIAAWLECPDHGVLRDTRETLLAVADAIRSGAWRKEQGK